MVADEMARCVSLRKTERALKLGTDEAPRDIFTFVS